MSDIPLKNKVISALQEIFDPEIPVNIYDLGLIYGVDTLEDHTVQITMTLTSPACPVAGTLPGEVEQKVKEVDGVTDCAVELVWEPTWEQSMMTDEAKLQLNLM